METAEEKEVRGSTERKHNRRRALLTVGARTAKSSQSTAVRRAMSGWHSTPVVKLYLLMDWQPMAKDVAVELQSSILLPVAERHQTCAAVTSQQHSRRGQQK